MVTHWYHGSQNHFSHDIITSIYISKSVTQPLKQVLNKRFIFFKAIETLEENFKGKKQSKTRSCVACAPEAGQCPQGEALGLQGHTLLCGSHHAAASGLAWVTVQAVASNCAVIAFWTPKAVWPGSKQRKATEGVWLFQQPAFPPTPASHRLLLTRAKPGMGKTEASSCSHVWEG